MRVAVVGDSYVHGAFVDTADGFPEVLEATLKSPAAHDAEVYRFGMDGAPLSQYLQVIRSEAFDTSPTSSSSSSSTTISMRASAGSAPAITRVS